jgi:hypothetical protein
MTYTLYKKQEKYDNAYLNKSETVSEESMQELNIKNHCCPTKLGEK